MRTSIRALIMIVALAVFTFTAGCSTKLINAIDRGDNNRARELIDQGADINEDDINNQSPLAWAAAKGNVEMVKLLLSKGARDKYGMALCRAAGIGHMEIAGMLLDSGSDIEGTDPYVGGGPALLSAVAGNKMDMAKYLISRGASIDKSINVCNQWLAYFSQRPSYWGSFIPAVKNYIVVLQQLKAAPVAVKPVAAPKGQTVYLNDGSVILGAVIAQDRESVTLKTKFATMKIGKDKIKQIKYK